MGVGKGMNRLKESCTGKTSTEGFRAREVIRGLFVALESTSRGLCARHIHCRILISRLF